MSNSNTISSDGQVRSFRCVKYPFFKGAFNVGAAITFVFLLSMKARRTHEFPSFCTQQFDFASSFAVFICTGVKMSPTFASGGHRFLPRPFMSASVGERICCVASRMSPNSGRSSMPPPPLSVNLGVEVLALELTMTDAVVTGVPQGRETVLLAVAVVVVVAVVVIVGSEVGVTLSSISKAEASDLG